MLLISCNNQQFNTEFKSQRYNTLPLSVFTIYQTMCTVWAHQQDVTIAWPTWKQLLQSCLLLSWMHKWSNTGNFYSCIFLYSRSIFECLCTACIAEGDASPDTINLWFVSSCHKRAVVYMNWFSVRRHKRSQIRERISLFRKMPAKTNQINNIYYVSFDEDFYQFFTEGFHQFPTKQHFWSRRDHVDSVTAMCISLSLWWWFSL